MSSEPIVEKKKRPIAKLAIAGVVLLVGAVLILRGVDVLAPLDMPIQGTIALWPAALGST